MHFAGIIDHLPDAPKMELFIWSSTVAIVTFSILQTRRQLARPRPKAGDIKAGSAGPRIWSALSILGQVGGTRLSLLVYWTATAYNRFRQPKWLTEYALPPPPDIFGVDGVVVGRGVGLLTFLAGMGFARIAVKALGGEFQGIRVNTYFVALPENNLRSSRIADQGEA